MSRKTTPRHIVINTKSRKAAQKVYEDFFHHLRGNQSVEGNLVDPVVVFTKDKYLAGERAALAGFISAHKNVQFEFDAKMGVTMRDLHLVFFNQELADAQQLQLTLLNIFLQDGEKNGFDDVLANCIDAHLLEISKLSAVYFANRQ